MTTTLRPLVFLAPALAILALAACSGQPTVDAASSPQITTAPGTAAPGAAAPPPTADAAVRGTPVVVGRPARVFIMAGVGKNCEMLPAPQITVTVSPTQGDVTFVPDQPTTIQTTAKGTCLGQPAKGTGIYYTARQGATGADRFSVTAALASGESASRSFEVKIAE